MRRRPVAIIFTSAVAGAAIVAMIWGLCSFDARVLDRFMILKTRRPWPAGAAFLTETEALRIADLAMEAAGYPTSGWLPLKDDRSQAPDGRPDEYLVRNTIDPNDGMIMFRNASREDWYRDLFVSFERKGDKLHVAVYRGK